MENIINEIRENIKALEGYFIWEVEEGYQKNTVEVLTVDNTSNNLMTTVLVIDGEKSRISKKYFSNNGINPNSIKNILNKYNVGLY